MSNYVKVVDYPSTDFLARNVIKYDGRAVFFAVAELLVSKAIDKALTNNVRNGDSDSNDRLQMRLPKKSYCEMQNLTRLYCPCHLGQTTRECV